MNKEKTASVQTALLHGLIGLVCGPGCEPFSGAVARGSESACADPDGPKGRSFATPRPARPVPCRVVTANRAPQRVGRACPLPV